MDFVESVPGLVIGYENGDIVIRVERKIASPMLSILLHSKFSDGPRIEFLTNPHVNALIEALMTASSLTEYMATRKGMGKALAPIIELVEGWARRESLPADEAASVLRSAIYPYNAT